MSDGVAMSAARGKQQAAAATLLYCRTPNVQIISKVYLRRKDQPRTYALNKKDAKMVSDAAKKKL